MLPCLICCPLTNININWVFSPQQTESTAERNAIVSPRFHVITRAVEQSPPRQQSVHKQISDGGVDLRGLTQTVYISLSDSCVSMVSQLRLHHYEIKIQKYFYWNGHNLFVHQLL